MNTAQAGCQCGCNTLTLVTRAAEPCGCGCDCCSAAPATIEDQITELQRLRDHVDRRLRFLQNS